MFYFDILPLVSHQLLPLYIDLSFSPYLLVTASLLLNRRHCCCLFPWWSRTHCNLSPVVGPDAPLLDASQLQSLRATWSWQSPHPISFSSCSFSCFSFIRTCFCSCSGLIGSYLIYLISYISSAPVPAPASFQLLSHWSLLWPWSLLFLFHWLIWDSAGCRHPEVSM